MKVNFTKHLMGVLRGLPDKQSWNTNIRPLIGLLGVLVAALSADLNEFVSGGALIDVRGALGTSADPGHWIDSLYASIAFYCIISVVMPPSIRRRGFY